MYPETIHINLFIYKTMLYTKGLSLCVKYFNTVKSWGEVKPDVGFCDVLLKISNFWFDFQDTYGTFYSVLSHFYLFTFTIKHLKQLMAAVVCLFVFCNSSSPSSRTARNKVNISCLLETRPAAGSFLIEQILNLLTIAALFAATMWLKLF